MALSRWNSALASASEPMPPYALAHCAPHTQPALMASLPRAGALASFARLLPPAPDISQDNGPASALAYAAGAPAKLPARF